MTANLKLPASDVELLQTLSNLFGPPGFEEEVAAWIAPRVAPLARKVEVDPLGNVLVWLATGRKGKKKDKCPVLMLDAHMDEIGLIVSHIDARGFVSLQPLGGWDERIVPASRVTIARRDGGRVLGVIGTPPPHIQTGERKVLDWKDLKCDVGAASADEVAAWGVRIGDPAVVHYPATTLGRPDLPGEPDAITGKAFDDRAGCAALLRLAERFAAAPPAGVELVMSFSVAEEVGLRGAKTAAYTLDPDFAIALEGTVAADVPGVSDEACPSRQRQGAAISLADRTIVIQRRVVDWARDMAVASSIPAQVKQPTSGGTDAGSIHLSRGGVPSMVVSVPCRYIHSPVTTLRLADFRAVVDLVERLVRDAPSRPWFVRR